MDIVETVFLQHYIDSTTINLRYKALLTTLTSKRWDTMKDFENVFKLTFERPKCVDYWKTEEHFGLMRLQGVAPTLITLCAEIPNK